MIQLFFLLRNERPEAKVIENIEREKPISVGDQ